MEQLEINPRARAEALSLAQLANLHNALRSGAAPQKR